MTKEAFLDFFPLCVLETMIIMNSSEDGWSLGMTYIEIKLKDSNPFHPLIHSNPFHPMRYKLLKRH